MKVDLFPHQRRAIDKLHNGSILWGGVGTGKSRAALVYYMEKEKGKDVYVITTAKKRDEGDWQREADSFGITTLTVDSWNNLPKYTDVQKSFFIFDEQRLVGSGAWTKSFLKIVKYNNWIMLTATPGDTWMDYIPVFVANGFYRNRTEFKREHVVYNTFTKWPKVDRYVNVGRLVRHRNQILVQMPYQMHTTRKSMDIKVQYNHALMDDVMYKRWNPYENRPIRDVGELYYLMRKVANSDKSRLEELVRLLSVHPRLIVFYNFDYELEILRCLKDLLPRHVCTESSYKSSSEARSRSVGAANQPSTTSSTTSSSGGSTLQLTCTCKDLVIAEWNGHKHQPIPDSKSWVYLVQYTAGSEAWESIATDAMVFYSQTYSYKTYHQAHGRIDRMTTPFDVIFYYNFVSDSYIDKSIKKSLRAKKDFQEKGSW